MERLLALQGGKNDRLRILMTVTPILRSSIAAPRTGLPPKDKGRKRSQG